MRVTEEIVKAYRSLPEWVKKEMKLVANPGWIFSGNEIIGWSWHANCLEGPIESEFIPSEPDYYIDNLRRLLFNYEDSIDMIAKRAGKLIKLGIEVPTDKDVITLWGCGVDNITAFLDLLNVAAKYYWYKNCPSLKDLKSDKFYSESSYFDPSTFEVNFFVNQFKEACITVNDFLFMRKFISKYHRFMLDEVDVKDPDGATMLCEYYHGRISMMEGEFNLYSMHGVTSDGIFNDIIKQNKNNWLYPNYYSSNGQQVDQGNLFGINSSPATNPSNPGYVLKKETFPSKPGKVNWK